MSATGSAFDRTMMARAVELAARGRGAVEPNPYVGCVIVREGHIVGEGAHAGYGGKHAEVVALERAGAAARGATAYVTLEPCHHRGKRPPCDVELIKAGVRRVVVACRDRNPAAGGGIRALRDAGRGVETLAHAPARQLVVPFFAHLDGDRPFVVAKWAMTADGRIATGTGDSKYVTGEAARRRVHRERARCDAILVGSGTVLADDPDLRARGVRSRMRARIVLDRRLRTPVDATVVRTSDRVETWIVTRHDAPATRVRRLEAAGVRVIGLRGRVGVPAMLRRLRREGIGRLLVEGGSDVHGAFFDAKAVDRVQVHIAPRILGGADGLGPIGGTGPAAMAGALPLVGVVTRRAGSDVVLEGEPATTGWGVRAGLP